MSGELPEERWLPTQTVTTIMLSFQSMLSDPNINSPANLDASIQWRDKRDEFLQRVKVLVERANKRVPPHVKIPHPDTDPEERKHTVEKMKQMQKLQNSFTLHDDDGEEDNESGSLDGGQDDDEEDDMDDCGGLDGSEEEHDEEDEEDDDKELKKEKKKLDIVDCPQCKASMLAKQNYLQCATCPIRMKEKGQFICGRKCYILDCGEVLPTGICQEITTASNSWKCHKNTHSDDANGEQNFMQASF